MFKAKSYTANKKYLYGYIIDITRPSLDNQTASAICLEYICSDVMNNGSLINKTYIVTRPIGCQFVKSGHDLDLYQGQYPYPLPPLTRITRFICNVSLTSFLLPVPGLYNSLSILHRVLRRAVAELET